MVRKRDLCLVLSTSGWKWEVISANGSVVGWKTTKGSNGDMQGIFRRIMMAVNDMAGHLRGSNGEGEFVKGDQVVGEVVKGKGEG